MTRRLSAAHTAATRASGPTTPSPPSRPRGGMHGWNGGFARTCAQRRGRVAFVAGVTFPKKADIAGEERHQEWLVARLNQGFEHETYDGWPRVWSYRYPEQLLIASTFDEQADRLAKWVLERFDALTARPAYLGATSRLPANSKTANSLAPLGATAEFRLLRDLCGEFPRRVDHRETGSLPLGRAARRGASRQRPSPRTLGSPFTRPNCEGAAAGSRRCAFIARLDLAPIIRLGRRGVATPDGPCALQSSAL